jgi:recombination protein RecT
MATAAPAKPAESKALTIVERVEQSPVVRMLEDRASALMELLPDQAAADRFRRVSVQAIVKNPELLECTAESVILSIFEAAAQGLEPTGAAGGAHLVPYNVNVGTKDRPHYEKRAQLIPDYRGVIRLVTKPPSDVQSLEARVVKEGDEFAYELGLQPVIVHVPSLATDASTKPTTHVYAIARLRDGSSIPDVMDRAAVERIHERGGRGRGFSPWASDWDEMAKKTVIKRLAKVLPVRPEIRSILIREDELLGVRDEDAPVATAPTGRQSRASQLASRLAKDVTPPEEPADDEPEPTEPGLPAGLTLEQLASELERLQVSRPYAIEESKRLFPREANVPLTDEQRYELVQHLAAQEPEGQAL